MTQFKNKRWSAEVIIWFLIITDRFHARLLAIVYARERANEIHECVFLFPVSHSSRVAILSRALLSFSRYAIIAEKISQFHKSFVKYRLSNLLRKQKGADFRGALTIEVVKVWKLVYFLSLRPRELPIKKSRVVHIRELFIRRVLTVSLLFISLSRSKWREEDQHCTRFMASGSWYQQNILSHVPEDAISPKGV